MGPRDRQKLETARYIIVDPSSQDGLVEVVETGHIPVGYINRYVSESQVRCSFCKGHQTHYRGYTAELSDGRLALIGIDCGKRLFGAGNASSWKKELERLEQSRAEEELLFKLKLGVDQVLALLDGKWVNLENQWSEFLDFLPQVSASKTAKQMVDGRHCRMGALEAAVRELADGSVVKYETFKETGRVFEMSVIWDQKHRLRDAARIARILNDGRDARGDLLTSAKLLEHRSQLIEAVRDGVSWMNHAQAFLQPDNLRRYDSLCRSVGMSFRITVKQHAGTTEVRVKVREQRWQWDEHEDGEAPVSRKLLPPLDECPQERDILQPLLVETAA